MKDYSKWKIMLFVLLSPWIIALGFFMDVVLGSDNAFFRRVQAWLEDDSER